MPLQRAVQLSGPPRLRAEVDAAPGARLVAIVYDVGPDGRASLITRGASLISGGAVELDLYPQDWALARGHRVAVLLAGSDDFYFAPGTTGSRVTVEDGSISLPLVEVRPSRLGAPSRAVAERTSFPIEPDVLAGSGSRLILPTFARPRLRVLVRPRRVRAARRVVVLMRVLGGRRRPVAGARLRVLGRVARTGRRGRARLRVRLRRPGRYVVRATKPGFAPGRATLRAVR
jgi:hypothetical protein